MSHYLRIVGTVPPRFSPKLLVVGAIAAKYLVIH